MSFSIFHQPWASQAYYLPYTLAITQAPFLLSETTSLPFFTQTQNSCSLITYLFSFHSLVNFPPPTSNSVPLASICMWCCQSIVSLPPITHWNQPVLSPTCLPSIHQSPSSPSSPPPIIDQILLMKKRILNNANYLLFRSTVRFQVGSHLEAKRRYHFEAKKMMAQVNYYYCITPDCLLFGPLFSIIYFASADFCCSKLDGTQ